MANVPKDLPPPPDLTGRRIGSLTVKDRIAVGGFGVVFKAWDEVLHVFRAVKIVHSNKISAPKQIELFENEMRTLAQLDHPNIVRMLYPILEPDLRGYVMEYVPGVTLRKLIREKKRLGLHQAIEIAAQVAGAMAHAHSLSPPAIHRDLTPENVLVRPDGVVKVTDFGIAKRVDDQSWSYTPGVTGKPRYMSPETFEGIITQSCDIYALGVILYELVAGRTPFEAGSSVGYYKLHREQMVEPPSRAVPDLPWKLESILLRALAKRSSSRYERMDDLVEPLRLLQALIRTGAVSLFTPSEREFQAQFQAAYGHFAAGRWDACAEAVKPILDADPDHVVAKETLELCQRKSAEPVQVGAGELEVSTTMRRGLLYFVKGRFREAKEHLERVLERDPNHEEARSFLDQAQLRLQPGGETASPDRTAEEYFQEGCRWLHDRNYSMAVVYFDLALEVDPTHEEAKDHREVAELRHREVRVEQKRLTDKRRKVDVQMAEAMQLFQSHAFSLARDRFKEILAVDPMNAEARKHRILCEEKRFEMERAQQKKGQADSAAELLREGQEALAKRDFARAVSAFEKTLELRKDDPEATRLLAQARAARDKRETELAFLRKRGHESLEKNEFEEALSFLGKLRELAPDEPDLAATIAQAETRLEARRRARAIAEKLQLALQLFALEQWQEALKATEGVLALDPRHADAAEYQRRCQEKLAAVRAAASAGAGATAASATVAAAENAAAPSATATTSPPASAAAPSGRSSSSALPEIPASATSGPAASKGSSPAPPAIASAKPAPASGAPAGQGSSPALPAIASAKPFPAPAASGAGHAPSGATASQGSSPALPPVPSAKPAPAPAASGAAASQGSSLALPAIPPAKPAPAPAASGAAASPGSSPALPLVPSPKPAPASAAPATSGAPSGKSSSPALPADRAATPDGDPATPAENPRGHSPTLISRLREANRLEKALDDAGQGKGSLVVVSGESGSGKTRLVRDFLAQNEFRSTLFFTAECPRDLSTPFAAIKEMVPQAIRKLDEVDPEQCIKTLMKWGPEISKLVPDLREKLYPLGIQPNLDAGPERLLEVARDFWLELAQMRTIAWVIERIEWLDRSSYEVLQELHPLLKSLPFLVIGTFFPDKKVESNPFPRWLGELRRERTVVEIAMAAFSPGDVEAYLRAALHWDRPEPALTAEIHTLSSGNPAKVERMVGYLIDHSILTKDGAGWAVRGRASEGLDLALGMTEELVRKLDSVSKKHVALLQALAVFPRPIGFKVVREVTGVPETQLYYLVNDLVGERMVVEQAEKSGTLYEIITAKFRDRVYRSIPADERGKLHERAAKAMEGLLAELGEDALAEIADQYLKANLGEKIVEFSLRAGDAALARGLNGRAMEHFRAVDENAHRARNREGVQADLLERMGVAGVRMGEGETAVRRLSQALTAAAKRPERALGILRQLAAASLRHDRFTEASRHLEGAFNLLGRKERAADVDLHLVLARSALAREDQTKTEELLRAVVERGKAANRRDTLAEAQLLQGQVAWLRGDWDASLAAYQEATAFFDKADLRLPAAESRLGAARVWLARARKAEAREALEGALAAARAMPDPWIEAAALLGFGELAWRHSEPVSASDWLRRAVQLCEAHDAPRLLARGQLLLAEMTLVYGDIDGGREKAMDSFIRFERLGLREGMAQGSRLLAECNLRGGSGERALQDARRAMDLVEKGGYVSHYAAVAATLGEVLTERGEVGEAEPLIVAARDMAQKLQDPAGEARAVKAMGSVLNRKRNPKAAAQILHESLKMYEKAGDKVACADGRVGYAAFLLDAGANEAARKVASRNLKVARAIFAEAGARAALARIDGLMERCKEG